jgi:hypothetical protein
MTKQPAKAPFFLFGGLVPVLNKKEPMICEESHKYIGSASMRPALL